jgi:hypothetical protein
LSHFWDALLKHLGSSCRLSTAYHPQTDGQTERMNRVLEDMLRHFINPTRTDWDVLLPMMEFAINNSYNTSIRNTPFFLNYGRHPSTPLTREMESLVPTTDRKADWLNRALTEAKRCLEAAQQRQKAYADRTRAPITFRPGDRVLLSTKNFNKNKLMPKWVGPYPVKEMIGKAAVRLELPEQFRVHPTFHTSLVRPYRSDGTVQPPPPADWVGGEPAYKVERILFHRRVGSKPKTWEYLVKWEGQGHENDMWVPDSHFTDHSAQDLYWDNYFRCHPHADVRELCR